MRLGARRGAMGLAVAWAATLGLAVGCSSAQRAPTPPPIPTSNSADLGDMKIVAITPAPLPAAPHPTLPQFLGIHQVCTKLGGAAAHLFSRLATAMDLEGRFPALEPKPPILPLTDPANMADTAPPAVKTAAEVKAEEDQAPQKIQALRYLATLGCGGCYNKIEDALIEALNDCTESVRYEAALALRGKTSTSRPCCVYCKSSSCCSEKVRAKLHDVATGQSGKGEYKEPSERVRRIARMALAACGGPPQNKETGAPLEGPPGPQPTPATPVASNNGNNLSSSTVSVLQNSAPTPTGTAAMPNGAAPAAAAAPPTVAPAAAMAPSVPAPAPAAAAVPVAPSTPTAANTVTPASATQPSAATAPATVANAVATAAATTPANAAPATAAPANAVAPAYATAPATAARPTPSTHSQLLIDLALVAFQSTSAVGDDTIVARVNGEPIHDQQVAPLVQAQIARLREQGQVCDPARTRELLASEVQRAIDLKLVSDAARREIMAAGTAPAGDEMQQIEQWLNRRLALSENVSLVELTKEFDAQQKRFTLPAKVRYERITVDVAACGGRDKAAALLAAIQDRALGKPVALPQHDRRALETKNIGWTTAAEVTTPALSRALFTLPAGRMSQIIDERNQLCVVRVLERQAGGLRSFDEVSDQLRQDVLRRRRQEAEQRLIAELRQGAQITTTLDSP